MQLFYSVFPLTPFFTLACLGMIYLTWNRATTLEYFNGPWLLYSGMILVAIGGFVAIFRRRSILLAYDLFSLGSFGMWFVHWREVYRLDAPVFTWYPMFFVTVAVLLNRQVIYKSHLMDPIQMRMIELIHSFAFFHPMLLTSGVLLSIYFSEYFIFYPIVLLLVLIRCSFGIVLQNSRRSPIG